MGSISVYLGNLFGVDPNAVVLFFAILSAYPANFIYVIFYQKSSVHFKSIYFLLVGLLVTLLCYGQNVIHSLINCCVCYLVLKCFPNKIALVTNFVFTLSYLLYGYKVNQVDWQYSITWTIPQCLLTLKLIAFSFDIYDGQNNRNSNKKDPGSSRHLESAIYKIPSFIHFMAYCYFPGSFFVGPLIPYLSFYKFLQNKEYNDKAIYISLTRLLNGVFCLFIYIVGSIYWPLHYLQTEQFFDSGFWWKLTAMAIVSKFYMYKYIACWLLAESSCILSGITNNGMNFYEFTNLNLFVFETAASFSTIIKSYNITTNKFAFKYIYRRLKFLGNAYLSQIITLIFLSIWHGFESGYHLAFSNEFLLIYFEKHLSSYSKLLKEKLFLKTTYSDSIIWIVGKLYVFYFTGYSFVPFMFLYSELWYPVLKSVYFVGHLSLFVYLLISLGINHLFRQKTKSA